MVVVIEPRPVGEGRAYRKSGLADPRIFGFGAKVPWIANLAVCVYLALSKHAVL